MKKRYLIVLMGAMVMLAIAGCSMSEDKQKEGVTKVPGENLTEVPEEEVTPTEKVEIKEPVQDEDEFPYVVAFSGKDETEEVKDGEVTYFKSAIHYPVFEGKNADNMNRFVTSLVEEFREILPDAKESAKFDYEDSKKNEFGMQIFPEAEELTVSLVWSKEQITVLKAEYYSNTGGAHPNIAYKAYVVDMTSGYGETFESMLGAYGLTTDEVVDFAVARFREEHGDELFETDNEEELKNQVHMLTQTHQWYFNENGLVIFANPYDIAAYAYGMIECEISYEELEEGLKK